jgi:hypothetical protein
MKLLGHEGVDSKPKHKKERSEAVKQIKLKNKNNWPMQV